METDCFVFEHLGSDSPIIQEKDITAVTPIDFKETETYSIYFYLSGGHMIIVTFKNKEKRDKVIELLRYRMPFMGGGEIQPL